MYSNTIYQNPKYLETGLLNDAEDLSIKIFLREIEIRSWVVAMEGTSVDLWG